MAGMSPYPRAVMQRVMRGRFSRIDQSVGRCVVLLVSNSVPLPSKRTHPILSGAFHSIRKHCLGRVGALEGHARSWKWRCWRVPNLTHFTKLIGMTSPWPRVYSSRIPV